MCIIDRRIYKYHIFVVPAKCAPTQKLVGTLLAKSGFTICCCCFLYLPFWHVQMHDLTIYNTTQRRAHNTHIYINSVLEIECRMNLRKKWKKKNASLNGLQWAAAAAGAPTKVKISLVGEGCELIVYWLWPNGATIALIVMTMRMDHFHPNSW